MKQDQLNEEKRLLVQRLMKRQANLSLRVGAVFLVMLLGIPLFNLYQPNIANMNVSGFSISWLFLGVFFFPITWFLSAYFIKESDKIEASTATESAKGDSQ